MLPAFIRFLEENRLLRFKDFGFDTRLKIQKYSYLAREFDLDMGYEYSMYRYGPYSPDLADEYYELSETPERFGPDEHAPLPEDFDSNGFLRLISGRTSGWLEVASTLVDQQDMFTDDAMLLEHVESIKCNHDADFIRTVFYDLRDQRVL